jgi:hypothetical protein
MFFIDFLSVCRWSKKWMLLGYSISVNKQALKFMWATKNAIMLHYSRDKSIYAT